MVDETYHTIPWSGEGSRQDGITRYPPQKEKENNGGRKRNRTYFQDWTRRGQRGESRSQGAGRDQLVPHAFACRDTPYCTAAACLHAHLLCYTSTLQGKETSRPELRLFSRTGFPSGRIQSATEPHSFIDHLPPTRHALVLALYALLRDC